MPISLRSAGMALAVLAGASLSAPAAAVVTTFASFNPVGTATNVRFEQGAGANGTFYSTSSGTATRPGDALVRFSFLQDGLNTAFSGVLARFNLAGVTVASPASQFGDSVIQRINSGRFSFLLDQDVTYQGQTFRAGTNLLSATFTDASLAGQLGGTSGRVNASSTSGSTIVFTSDVADVTRLGDRDLAFALTAIRPSLAQSFAGRTVDGFRASASGNFSADLPSTTAIPEPEVWALLVGGFGIAGSMLRRRRPQPRVVLA